MQSQQRLGIERFPPYWGKKSGFGSSQSSSSAEGNVTGRVQSEGQLGELGLFSLNERRLRKCCEVVQESLFLCEGQDSPSQAALSFSLAAGQCLDTSCGCRALAWPLRVSHPAQGSGGLFWAGLKPSWPSSGEGLGPKHESHPQQWRTGTRGFIIPVLS